MFNSYASGGRATSSANNYLKINAINGTLVKNHPQSIFVQARIDSTIFDPTNPRCIFPNAETYQDTERRQSGYTPGYGWNWEEYKVTRKRDVEVPCIVLQAMIIGDGLFLCEIVKTSDFFGANQTTDKGDE